MGGYKISIKASAAKEIEGLPKRVLVKVLERIGALAADPRPNGCEKLGGIELYRLRQGRYRIVYSIEDHGLTVWVIKVGHRREVYR
jgi:mRNA interferase RelE/StbE